MKSIISRILLSLLCVDIVTAFSAATPPVILSTKDVVSKVAVTGATGRTGRLVVKELRNRGVNVVAIVRDLEKAKEVFSDEDDGIHIREMNLASEEEIDLNHSAVLKECDAAIWCATGFSEKKKEPEPEEEKEDVGFLSMLQQKVLEIFQIEEENSEEVEEEKPEMISIDAIGVPAVAKYFTSTEDGYPKMILLSSAGVTRPSWDEVKKEKFRGAAEIPIVRLNPFGILGIKAASEESLRQKDDVPYCIVRPTGLNDDWPCKSRPVFSQGDLAVGRINRGDVATLLVDVLSTPEATNKTFEAFTLAGYAPPLSLTPALERLKLDSELEGEDDLVTLEATYASLQQLLPGEKQDSSNIALGQTYEQMDKNEEGRFGPKGQERVEEVTLKPSSVS